ncbi:MAG: nucleoid DNA-binding protein [Oceanicoccus sp.]|jgi:nucleoid DNA-binding protein
MATKKKAAPKQKAAPAKKVAPKKKVVAKAAPAKKAVAKKVAAPKKAVAKKAAAPKKVVAKKVAAPKKVVAKKAPVKKAPVKKAAAKPVPAKKAVVKKAAEPKRRTTAIKAKMTKTQMFAEIASAADLNTKQVAAVFNELEGLLGRSIKKGGLGEFTVPGLMKVTTVKKPAKKARKGVNPFTGEEQMFKAKPASMAVKVRPLKKLKEFAAS